jgi:hypothetical protein
MSGIEIPMMDTTRSKAALNDFKTTSFAEDDVLFRNTHIIEDDFGVAMRGIL